MILNFEVYPVSDRRCASPLLPLLSFLPYLTYSLCALRMYGGPFIILRLLPGGVKARGLRLIYRRGRDKGRHSSITS